MEITTAMVQESLEMFVFLSIELTLLFLVISYVVGILQRYIPPARIQSILSSQKGKGYVIAAFLGAITPFCSCSTIPFLKGLLRANAGFGTMMVFLFTSPLVNPIILGLFLATFGIKATFFYFLLAMSVSISAGYFLEKAGFAKYIKPEVYQDPQTSCSSSGGSSSCSSSGGSSSSCSSSPQQEINPWLQIWKNTWTDFKKVFPYLLGGIVIGSLIYGFIPTELISRFAHQENLFAIPLAAVIGIPLYIRAEAVIPLSAVLVTKGMGLGAVMALIIGSAGASLTEVILLKSIFQNKMIYAFLTVVLGMAILCGYLFNTL